MKTHKEVIEEAKAQEASQSEAAAMEAVVTRSKLSQGEGHQSPAWIVKQRERDAEKDRLEKEAVAKWPPQGEPQNVEPDVISPGTLAYDYADLQNALTAKENPYHKEGVSDPNMLVACITRAASDPSVDPARMQQLMEIYERIAAKESERQFNTALRDAQNEMPKLVKDAEAPGYRYLTLETIGRIIDPITRRHGFAESYGTDDSPIDGHYRVICHLSHVGGYTRLYHADLPADTKGPKGTSTKTGVQGFGSTMSYGIRYLKKLMFNLVIVGEDDDGRVGWKKPEFREPFSARAEDFITTGQMAEIALLLEETGRSLERFMKFKCIGSLGEIRASDFERTLAEIRQIAGRAGQ